MERGITANIYFKTGEYVFNVPAKRVNGRWLIGGDWVDWEIIETVVIVSSTGTYVLKGNRLIRQ